MFVGGCLDPPAHPPTVATEAIVLSAGEAEDSLNGEDMAEYAISKVINSQFSGMFWCEERERESKFWCSDYKSYGFVRQV